MRLRRLFAECYRRPERQDWVYLWTKAFGVNLAVRGAFLGAAAARGDMGAARALWAGVWYQAQDALFTLYGRTYMNLVARADKALGPAGGFVFVYFQLCGFELLNRLMLGPVGQNAPVTEPAGALLVFVNTLQGMVAGGPLVPALGRLRAAGLVSERAAGHLYQASGLTLHLGLLATFGFQTAYAVATGLLFALSWGAYAAALARPSHTG